VLDLTEKVRQSIQVSGQQLVGRIILDVRQDGAICKLIAHEGYDASQGARSLKAAVETRIEDELVIRYLEEDGRIEDWQPMVRYTVDLSRNGVLSVFKTVE
jgi:ATP-dependent Clp protease ATP-binding subunit ClpA